MKIGVLMGGVSSEREVSLKSGREIIKNLDKNKYEIYQIIINSKEEVMKKVRGMDFIFIALHGEFGEDGTVQAILQSMGIKYSGSGVLSSALCMDKIQSKRILKSEGIDVPNGFLISRYKNLNEIYDLKEIKDIKYPAVVKPNNGGSSICTFLVNSEKELFNAISKILEKNLDVIVEEYIKGDEYTVPILNGEPLNILKIKPKGNFFDYDSKYNKFGAEFLVCNLDKGIHDRINETAVKCFNLFNCSVIARIDIILREEKIYVLEINTLPGMTENSLVPMSAKASKIPFSKLLDLIIQYSIKERLV